MTWSEGAFAWFDLLWKCRQDLVKLRQPLGPLNPDPTCTPQQPHMGHGAQHVHQRWIDWIARSHHRTCRRAVQPRLGCHETRQVQVSQWRVEGVVTQSTQVTLEQFGEWQDVWNGDALQRQGARRRVQTVLQWTQLHLERGARRSKLVLKMLPCAAQATYLSTDYTTNILTKLASYAPTPTAFAPSTSSEPATNSQSEHCPLLLLQLQNSIPLQLRHLTVAAVFQRQL